MPNPRLTMALEQLDSGHWLDFERFAAEFLVVDFPNLRTTASGSGDRGRDGQLYEIDSEPGVMIQIGVNGLA